MKRFLKILAFISILALIVNFIGCQATGDKKQPDGAKDVSTTDEKTTAASTDSNADDNLNPLGTFPIAKTKTKLSLLMAQDPLVEDYETNSFTKWVEDRCNIDLEFEILPAADSGDKLAIMISSNQTLPDVVNMGLNIVTTYKYGSGGAFIPLNDYYETQAYYIKQQLEKYPETDIIRYTQTPDGKLYSIPSYYKENHSEVRWKYWINTHWLNKLGLEMPTTTDDLYTVLKAFKERDPNGNNKADEYGIVGSTGGGRIKEKQANKMRSLVKPA
jgi:putative aldouronate transport system substrate-binding protein